MKRPNGANKGSEGPSSAAARTIPLFGAVAGYIRVSTPSQDYAYQRHAIEAAAGARGEQVDRWFGDVASGGTMDRPELERLRQALEQRCITRVWVWRLDRLSRSGIGDTLECVAAVRRAGATLASVADPFALEDGPGAELVLAVMAWAAQFEREKIRENQQAARARRAQQGLGWGRPGLATATIDAIGVLASQGKTVREIARELQISRGVVGKYMPRKNRGL